MVGAKRNPSYPQRIIRPLYCFVGNQSPKQTPIAFAISTNSPFTSTDLLQPITSSKETYVLDKSKYTCGLVSPDCVTGQSVLKLGD